MIHVCVNAAKATLFHMLASFHYVQLVLGVRSFFLFIYYSAYKLVNFESIHILLC